jgi:hypothetical protein
VRFAILLSPPRGVGKVETAIEYHPTRVVEVRKKLRGGYQFIERDVIVHQDHLVCSSVEFTGQ